MQQETPPPLLFEEGVSQILVLTEELKRSFETRNVVDWQAELEIMLEKLDTLSRICQDFPEDQVKKDLYQHCQLKCKALCLQILQFQSDKDVPEQAAVARIVELSLAVDDTSDSEYATQVTNFYVSYQRFILRDRCKPAIAYLAQWRQQDNPMEMAAADDDDPSNNVIARPHAHAMTVILGEASSLIHPLLLWKEQLPEHHVLREMCEKAVQTLDEQAQTLTKTVSDWFWVDRKIDDYMSQVATSETKDSSPQPTVDLAELDALVEEMAFECQLLARYQTLMATNDTPLASLVEEEMLPEWTWKYASLERFLARQQWTSALNMACPVSIVIGTAVQVPSEVEDAQYLSTRALERASSTLSQQAIGTLAHSISHDIWSTDDMDGGGVHQALLDQRGCWATTAELEPKASNTTTTKSTNHDGTFASALLDALDDDLKTTSPPASSSFNKAPTSGGFLGSLVGSQHEDVRLDMQLCQLNGIHSSSTACTYLSKSLEEEQEEGTSVAKTSSMTELAREDLLRYANAYQLLLTNQIQSVVQEWCRNTDSRSKNKCLFTLRDFFQREKFKLNAATFQEAESDERLERDMLGPLRESRLIQSLPKCDSAVAFLLCKELSLQLSTLLLESLWKGKKFTDWGSLLLSKQVRMLQTYLLSLVEENAAHTAGLLREWQRVSQAVTLLQLEKPSDWAAYRSTTGNVLSNDQVKRTLILRVDFQVMP